MPTSTFEGNKIIDHMLRGQAYTPPVAIYVSLHTDDPGLDGANEVTGGSYQRQAITLGAAANKASDNTGILTFAGMPACTVSASGIWDAQTNGNFLWPGTATSRTLQAGDSYQFPVGSFDLTIT